MSGKQNLSNAMGMAFVIGPVIIILWEIIKMIFGW